MRVNKHSLPLNARSTADDDAGGQKVYSSSGIMLYGNVYIHRVPKIVPHLWPAITFDTRDAIWAIFDRNVTEKGNKNSNNQKMLYFVTSPN